MEVWQAARRLVREVYQLTGQGPMADDYALRDQLRKSVISIMSNVAEGFERNSDREFRRFLMIAKGSCGEARTQLIVAHDVGYVTMEDFKRLGSNMVAISSQLASLAAYLTRSLDHPNQEAAKSTKTEPPIPTDLRP